MRLLGKSSDKRLPSVPGFEEKKPERSTQEKIRDFVAEYVLLHYDELVELEAEDVYLISFNKDLHGAWNAWVNTTVDDHRLYQVVRTNQGELILNVFEKIDYVRRSADEVGF